MTTTRVAIIDSGGANIASLQFALQRLGVDSVLTAGEEEIRAATHIILPGVGAAADAMQRLQSRGLTTLIPKLTQPVLGICLGMQLLAECSEENNADCLEIIPGVVRKLPANSGTPVPNMGWCRIRIIREHDLLRNIEDGSFFYFLHSYSLAVNENALASSMHAEEFTSILAMRNYYATQFHPERSAAAGAQLLRNFLELRAC